MAYHFLALESCTCSLALAEESSAECFSDIPACVLSRLSPIAEKCSCNGNETVCCLVSQFGMMCGPSTASRGADALTLSAQESHANGCQQPEREEASLTRTITQPLSELFARLDPDSFSWRTPPSLFGADSGEFCGTWPNWGIMRDGECWALTTPDFLTVASGSGYLPTPSGTSNHGQNHVAGRLDEWGGSSNPWRKTEIGKLHCPRFEEWMMGWPDQWTALTPLGMGKFQQWQQQHGDY